MENNKNNLLSSLINHFGGILLIPSIFLIAEIIDSWRYLSPAISYFLIGAVTWAAIPNKEYIISKIILYYVKPITIGFLIVTVISYYVNKTLDQGITEPGVLKKYSQLIEAEHVFTSLIMLNLVINLCIILCILCITIYLPALKVATKFYRIKYYLFQSLLVLVTINTYSLVSISYNPATPIINRKIDEVYWIEIKRSIDYKTEQEGIKVLNYKLDHLKKSEDDNLGNILIEGFQAGRGIVNESMKRNIGNREYYLLSKHFNSEAQLGESLADEFVKKPNDELKESLRIEVIEAILNSNEIMKHEARNKFQLENKIEQLQALEQKNNESKIRNEEMRLFVRQSLKTVLSKLLSTQSLSVIESSAFLEAFTHKLIINYAERKISKAFLDKLIARISGNFQTPIEAKDVEFIEEQCFVEIEPTLKNDFRLTEELTNISMDKVVATVELKLSQEQDRELIEVKALMETESRMEEVKAKEIRVEFAK